MVCDLDEFRQMPQRDRERGDVRSQRYTFTLFSFLDLGDQGKPERAKQFQIPFKVGAKHTSTRLLAGSSPVSDET